MEYKRRILVAIWHQKCFDPLTISISKMRVLIHCVVCILGVALATDGVKPLRQTLHGTLARVAPTTIKKAVVVSMSEGASHFQKLPGK